VFQDVNNIHKYSRASDHFVDLETTYKILKAVSEARVATVRGIARTAGVSAATVYKHVNKMEGKGLVKTVKISKYRFITLTEKGEEVYKKLSEVMGIVHTYSLNLQWAT